MEIIIWELFYVIFEWVRRQWPELIFFMFFWKISFFTEKIIKKWILSRPWLEKSCSRLDFGRCVSKFGLSKSFVNLRFGTFDLILQKEKSLCPQKFVNPLNCGFNNCSYRISGLKISEGRTYKISDGQMGEYWKLLRNLWWKKKAVRRNGPILKSIQKLTVKLTKVMKFLHAPFAKVSVMKR